MESLELSQKDAQFRNKWRSTEKKKKKEKRRKKRRKKVDIQFMQSESGKLMSSRIALSHCIAN